MIQRVDIMLLELKALQHETLSERAARTFRAFRGIKMQTQLELRDGYFYQGSSEVPVIIPVQVKYIPMLGKVCELSPC